jgi:CRP-like cAMP-binding protein
MIESSYLEESPKLLDSLRKISVFEPFDDEQLHNLLRMSKIRKYKSGELILAEGTSDTWIYFLIYGKAKITKEDREVTMLSRRGDIFGEMSFIADSGRSASVYAEGDTVCLATDTFHVEKLKGDAKVAFFYVLYRIMAEILAERLRMTTKELMDARSKMNLKFW